MQSKTAQAKALPMPDVMRYIMVSGFFMALSAGVFVLSVL